MVSYSVSFGPGVSAGAEATRWPPFVTSAATLRDLLDGLANSQRLSSASLASNQAQQLAMLAVWASAHCSPYAARRTLAAELTGTVGDAERFWRNWQTWPVLSKADLRNHGAAMQADTVPAAQQPVEVLQTSGSTGIPVQIATTALTRQLWNALTAREHLWQRRDPARRLGVIRHRPRSARDPRGEDLPSWGPPMAELTGTGSASVIHVGLPVPVLAEWLRRFDPHYLLTYPSVADALLEELPALADRNPSLEEVRLISEPLDQALEARLRKDWDVHVTDMYSANEVGHIAFRCREQGRLHVQTESVLVEILDANGRSCAPGVPGRVVITALHNLATPLLRYDLGDFASLGPPCSCGRGLPVIEHVLGRTRNLIRTPDGRRYWPLGLGRIRVLNAIIQAQYVQTHIDAIELRVVASRPLSGEERGTAIELVRDSLGYPFTVNVLPVAAIERGPTGKFEEFLSLLDQ
jgi:phenylacetate-CoA ligase